MNTKMFARLITIALVVVLWFLLISESDSRGLLYGFIFVMVVLFIPIRFLIEYLIVKPIAYLINESKRREERRAYVENYVDRLTKYVGEEDTHVIKISEYLYDDEDITIPAQLSAEFSIDNNFEIRYYKGEYFRKGEPILFFFNTTFVYSSTGSVAKYYIAAPFDCKLIDIKSSAEILDDPFSKSQYIMAIREISESEQQLKIDKVTSAVWGENEIKYDFFYQTDSHNPKSHKVLLKEDPITKEVTIDLSYAHRGILLRFFDLKFYYENGLYHIEATYLNKHIVLKENSSLTFLFDDDSVIELKNEKRGYRYSKSSEGVIYKCDFPFGNQLIEALSSKMTKMIRLDPIGYDHHKDWTLRQKGSWPDATGEQRDLFITGKVIKYVEDNNLKSVERF